ncbi:MAG: hypothetical protein N2111_06030 [Candidatus Sumerlaeaceae bacterium]|nr:hypothetical protein [Candidatus Sumerlaeaceae bacterium]
MTYSCTRRLAVAAAILLMAAGGTAQPPGAIGQSSEWEATGFNNGRRMVRDSNGYFHVVWHSKPALPAGPSGAACDVFYAHTLVPSNEPPSMASQPGVWTAPVNMTALLGNSDNRYPSLAIEYDVYNQQWTQTNRIHVVWQAVPAFGNRYEVLYATIPVTNPPGAASPWVVATNLSQTPQTDSLVPSVAINSYSPDALNQHVHVVWQEEDVNNNGGIIGPPAEDAWFSDIAYTRSVNSGLSWAPPGGGWDPDGPGPLPPYAWDNITQTPFNSQMPSVCCILDQYAGTPAVAGRGDMGYNSTAVHVAYHQDFGVGGIRVLYKFSANDGAGWGAPVDVSQVAYAPPTPNDAYPNLAVDMLNRLHITFMRNNIVAAEPMRTGPNTYLAGINPSLVRSFPGPSVGMYGVQPNQVLYIWMSTTGSLEMLEQWSADDQEFPTVALNRWQHVNVNWQQFQATPPPGDYEIFRATFLNFVPPQFPPLRQHYVGFTPPASDSLDPANDDLFPNLSHQKTAMYLAPAPEPGNAGFDEVWTKITGHGPTGAINGLLVKSIMQSGNMGFDVFVPVRMSRFSVE